MEPGLAAAAYAAETVVEGAAAGAIAIAKPTVPLKTRFHRLAGPDPSLKRYSHTLSVIRGRGYVFGGDGEAVGSGGDNFVQMVTLPTDPALRDMDYQKIPPVGEGAPAARSGHTATVIGERIYIFGGSTPHGSSDPSTTPNPPLKEDGIVYVFNTMNKTWEALAPNETACASGFPEPRNYAKSSSTEHPLPIREENTGVPKVEELMSQEAKFRETTKHQGESFTATDDQLSEGYGTVFLHGGYDAKGSLLRDVWAFDVASRIWSKWPEMPNSEVETGEGHICCVDSRLWRCGDGFGKIAQLSIQRAAFNDLGGAGELGVTPKTGIWEVQSFGVKPGMEDVELKVEEKMGGRPANADHLFPSARKHFALHPITTGQGRYYLVLIMGEQPQGVLGDIWSFQVSSAKKSAAALKDAVRSLIGKDTGIEQWAQAQTVEESREDGKLDFPKGLSRFGSSPGGDWDDGILIWGGIGPGGEVSGDGWWLTLE